MSKSTLREWIQQIETEIAAARVNNHLFREEIANGTVKGISVVMIERSRQKLEWLKELQRYKDLEEAGRLIELPCKVGDTICEVVGNERIVTHSFQQQWRIARYLEEGIFGVYAFLTKAEAESKLAELKGGTE